MDLTLSLCAYRDNSLCNSVLLITDVMKEEYAVRRLAFMNKDVCYYWRDKVLKQQRDPIVNKMNCRSTVIHGFPG